jgi:hypothetical protein
MQATGQDKRIDGIWPNKKRFRVLHLELRRTWRLGLGGLEDTV